MTFDYDRTEEYYRNKLNPKTSKYDDVEILNLEDLRNEIDKIKTTVGDEEIVLMRDLDELLDKFEDQMN